MGGWCRGLCERTGQEAGHRQDACVAGRRAGFLPEHVADVLAHGFSPLHLESGIDCGEWLGQVPQIMGLTKLLATVGQDRGHCRDQARLLVAEHGSNRPLQVLERFQKGFERGLILLAEPATAQG